MRRSVLLCTNGLREDGGVIETAVTLAKQWNARLRCLTLLDTRRLSYLSNTSESAFEINGEYSSLFLRELYLTSIKSQLSQACVTANLDFDMRGTRGDPFLLLPTEAQFHDLTLTVFPSLSSEQECEGERLLSPCDLLKLVQGGVSPLLILREGVPAPQRILLAYDGSSSSIRAIRTFVQQNSFPDAEVRLLSLGKQDTHQDPNWREISDFCRTLVPDLELGYLNGTRHKSLLTYVQKWQADLVATGTTTGQFRWTRLRTDPLCKLMERSPVALFVMN